MVKLEEVENLSYLLGYLVDMLVRYRFVKEGKFSFLNPVIMEYEDEPVEPNEERAFEQKAKKRLDKIKEAFGAIDWTKLE